MCCLPEGGAGGLKGVKGDGIEGGGRGPGPYKRSKFYSDRCQLHVQSVCNTVSLAVCRQNRHEQMASTLRNTRQA